MRKQPNKILFIIGIIIIVAVPVITALFVSALAESLCVPQNLKGTEVCLPNAIPAFAITIGTPLVVGVVLIILSVIKKK